MRLNQLMKLFSSSQSWNNKATGKNKTMKSGNSDEPRSPYKVAFYLKNISLTMCQSSEHLEDILLTKLLGQFIEYIMLSYLKD